MNNSNLLGLLAVLFISLSIFSSCGKEDIDETNTTETETVVFDCPTLEQNFGDTCMTASGNFSAIDANCDCPENTIPFDCPTLSQNIGDSCMTAAGNFSVVDSDCNCLDNNSVDCTTWGLNFGDVCTYTTIDTTSNTQITITGTIDTSCDCVDSSNTFDCPGWGLNINDACSYYALDSMTMDSILIQGSLDVNCDCL